ncbi:MAG TPA: peroxiredoxin family protein [Actinomycetota bacterium]
MRKRSSRGSRWPSAWSLGIGVAVIGAVTAMLLASRSPGSSEGAGDEAPAFTLASTAGDPVSLADYRGQDVLLYFSEGAGCDSCFYQMADLEDNAAKLSASGLSVVPIVVNPADQVLAEMGRFGLTTPFLIDADRSVSDAYGVVGTGMHADLPGHSFVLVDGSGRIAWRGDYPSMFVSADQLLSDIGAAGRAPA